MKSCDCQNWHCNEYGGGRDAYDRKSGNKIGHLSGSPIQNCHMSNCFVGEEIHTLLRHAIDAELAGVEVPRREIRLLIEKVEEVGQQANYRQIFELWK